MEKKEKLVLLINAAFKINHLSDESNITEDFIREKIKDKTLFKYLHENYRNEPGLINDFECYTKEQTDYLYDILDRVGNCQLKEDYGIEKNNFNLLLAFILECMQIEISYNTGKKSGIQR